MTNNIINDDYVYGFSLEGYTQVYTTILASSVLYNFNLSSGSNY